MLAIGSAVEELPAEAAKQQAKKPEKNCISS